MAESHDVVITGIGPVTCIGTGCDALWESLCSGEARAGKRKLALDIGRFVELPLASMPPSDQVPGLQPHMDGLVEQGLDGYRDVAYSLLAIELALSDAKLEVDRHSHRFGMIQAFEAPGVERTVGELFGLFSGPPPTDGPPQVYERLAPRFYNMQPFLYVHLIAKAFGLHGYCTNLHNACSTGAFAIEAAAQRIRAGDADVMIVVGGEAFDTAVRLEWFRRLGLYACAAKMSPFSTEQSGFFVGEGAAAIILESDEHARSRGAKGYAIYLGGSFAHQGWKQTLPDIRAARLGKVIVDAMARFGGSDRSVDLIVPHAASTSLSDQYESVSLAQAWPSGSSDAVATAFKPYHGHLLACSGVLEVVCSMLAIKHQAVPPTLNAAAEFIGTDIPLVHELVTRPVNTILKLSTGFTGHDAAALFQRCS